MLNPLANGKIQGLFKAFECFSSTFQGRFYFQGLFKTVLFIQVLYKPVRTLVSIKSLADVVQGIGFYQGLTFLALLKISSILFNSENFSKFGT